MFVARYRHTGGTSLNMQGILEDGMNRWAAWVLRFFSDKLQAMQSALNLDPNHLHLNGLDAYPQ